MIPPVSTTGFAFAAVPGGPELLVLGLLLVVVVPLILGLVVLAVVVLLVRNADPDADSGAGESAERRGADADRAVAPNDRRTTDE